MPLIAILALGLAGVIGYAMHSTTSHDVNVERTFVGKVAVVGNNGQSGCVQPGRGKPVCADFYAETGASALRVGDTVHAAYETGDGVALLLIYTSN